MRILRPLVLAFGVFAASFALHIVGGATDQAWLFAIAVFLIYLAAAGFPTIAWLFGGARRADHALIAIGAGIGLVLTVAALWAANDRTLEWWQLPLAAALVTATSITIEAGRRLLTKLSGRAKARSRTPDARAPLES